MRRVIGAVGRVFVTVGLLILLFVAYELWGTNILEARAQNQLRDDFESKLESDPQTSSTSDDPTVTTTGSTTTTTTTTTAPPVAPLPPEGEPVAIIRIPRIGVDKVVVEGTSVADLRKGPGHYVGTPLPGQIGNAGIAGHRTTYGAPFADLDQLLPGDQVQVETLSGTFDYTVTEPPFVVNPGDTHVLEQPVAAEDDSVAATLTLTTCNPKYSARQRLIVRAEYQPVAANQPQPQAPPPQTRNVVAIDAGLSGEHTSRIPTVLWGLVVAGVGLLWWLVFHRHARWTTWVVGAIPFVVVLFVFYFFLERVLPANY